MRRIKRLRLLGILGALLALAWASAFAGFSDSATGESSFTSGSIDLELADDADDSYAFTSLDVTNVKPGDPARYAALKVENAAGAGNLSLTYSMATSATNADSKNLRDELQLGIRKVATSGDCAAVGYSASTDVAYAEGDLSSAAVGSRVLSAAANEVLCFKVWLPADPGAAGTADDNNFQAAATTATFTFSAVQ